MQDLGGNHATGTYTAAGTFYYGFEAHQLQAFKMIYLPAAKTMRKSTIRLCQLFLYFMCPVVWVATKNIAYAAC